MASTPSFEPSFGVRNIIFKPLHSTGGKPEFAPPYLVPQLKADMAGNNVVSTVFEEANFSYDKTQKNPLMAPLGEIAACQKIFDSTAKSDTQFCKGINGHASLAAGAAAVEPLLKAMCEHGIMRGIRDSCYTGVDRDGVIIPELMDHVASWSAPPAHGGLGLEGELISS